MTKIRIDTEHVREIGRRLVSQGDRVSEIGRELQRAIGGLDTGSWDGHSRARAEPMLSRVRPESARVADRLDDLGPNRAFRRKIHSLREHHGVPRRVDVERDDV